MTTLKIHTEIDADGKLRLDVPMGLPPGMAEVIIVVQPVATNGNTKPVAARSGLFLGQSGENIDIDAALAEMNQAWKSKLSGLP